ncbi:HWE histidine kinase domain-containing protein [Dongia deserti]|uniref:HWE histidine kinase domain-containing protein n=1 Tax=Dongia deserti TaxID=2268030 RepID=UPI0013C47AEC|nr:HWE histidine kinase domain-containing protein [Dongia deserti]
MWIERRLPRLRRHRALGLAAAAVLVAGAIAARAALPELPPFLTFFSAVLLSAFVGGRAAGLLALVATGLAAPFFLQPQFALPGSGWGLVQVAGYLATSGLIIFIVDLLDNAIGRLRAERERLSLALRAANAGTWEWIGQEVRWDRTFYDVTGLDPDTPPSIDDYLARVHPDDLPRMSRLRAYLAGEAEMAPVDEFRFTRPDGRTVWLQTYRAVVDKATRHMTGVTQDITARKENETRIALLLREVSHRAKNQYAVIAAVLRETAKSAQPEKLVEELEARLRAMARSQDLLVNTRWEGATIDAVVRTQLEPFGVGARCEILGAPIMISSTAVQYIGMALYELATNSIKYGALGAPNGKATISWSLVPAGAHGKASEFQFEWREEGGPNVHEVVSSGFGRKVLEQLVSFALDGHSTLIFHPSGISWALFAPANSVLPRQATYAID